MEKWIAVTGGCGYIGSHIACQIRENTDHKVLIIDRAASSMRHTHWLADELVDNDMVSDAATAALLALRPQAIIHCAGTSLVGPSISDPSDYYSNNVVKTLQILDLMRNNRLNNIIFSSSAAVYGESWATVCDEDCQPDPINPYGNTKAIIETMLKDYSKAYSINSMSFRYFNAAGADPQSRFGQAKDATHLLARIMENVLYGKELTVYGNKYPTKDGTCVRDYAHVCDIARAHVLAIDHLKFNPGAHVLNLGSGNGTTVMEMIEATAKVTGKEPSYTIGTERIGDPAILIANTHRANIDLKWQPRYNLGNIVLDARNWYLSDAYQSFKN